MTAPGRTGRRRGFGIACALVLPMAGAGSAAFAADDDAPTAAPADPDKAYGAALVQAEQLMVQNRPDEARAKLDEVEAIRPHDEQAEFLLGLLDMHEKDYVGAIGHFHRVLLSQPKTVRVRLELGRAYYEAGDYFDAQRQFQFARAGNLPPVVLANIDRYLASIRELKTLSFGFSLAVAPDTNLNAGPAIDSISLYGLPFTLSQDAKANSGVGLAVDANVEWSPRIAQHLKWRSGVALHRSQYLATEFDDMTLTAYSGPHVTLKRWDLNLFGTASRRWYGERTYSNSKGLSADATYYLSARMGLTAGGALSKVTYGLNPLQDGSGRSIGGGGFYALSPASIVRLNTNFAWQGARDRTLAYHAQQIGLSYSREFKGGITASVSPGYSRLAYEGFNVGFDATRRDHQYSVQLGLLDRRFDWGGFTPRVLYTFTHNDSNIPLYTFSRNRFEVGVTRSF